MPAKPKEYQRLPGRGTRRGPFLQAVATSSRLWLGRDHLLMVDWMGYSEDYKRFYFRDIQAITLTQTNRGRARNIICAAIVLPTALFAAMSGPVAAIAWGTVAGLFGLILLANVARGPTAVCHLRTAVQTEELPSLNRVRRARKVIGRIGPLITAAQEPIATEELRTRAAAMFPSGATGMPNVSPMIVPEPPAPGHE